MGLSVGLSMRVDVETYKQVIGFGEWISNSRDFSYHIYSFNGMVVVQVNTNPL